MAGLPLQGEWIEGGKQGRWGEWEDGRERKKIVSK